MQEQVLHKHTYPYKYPVGVRREMKRAEDKDSMPIQPLMPIRLSGIAFEALLDSGATHILIPRFTLISLVPIAFAHRLVSSPTAYVSVLSRDIGLQVFR